MDKINKLKINETVKNDMQLVDFMKNERVPSAKDSNNKIIFVKDYENRRVVLDLAYYEMLAESNQLNEYIDYLKGDKRVDYITLFWSENNNIIMVNVFIKEQKIYYVPMNYYDDNSGDINDESIHYSEKALEIKNNTAKEAAINVSEGRNMRFVSVKNPQNKSEFLPLFKSPQELRKIFKKEKYRICMITYEEAVQFAKEFSGLVFRPTVESLIIENDKALYFSDIDVFIKPKRDYKKYCANENTIQDKITKFQTFKNGTDEFNSYYRGILQSIADLDKLYIALSPKTLDLSKGTGLPLLHKVNDHLGFYVFSEIEIARQWCEHYKNYGPNGEMLIGIIEKEKEFNSLFSIASKMNINLCMIDEGGASLGFSINLFMDVNNFSHEITLCMTKKQAEEIVKNNEDKVKVNFNRINVMSLVKSNVDEEEYCEIKLNKIN